MLAKRHQYIALFLIFVSITLAACVSSSGYEPSNTVKSGVLGAVVSSGIGSMTSVGTGGGALIGTASGALIGYYFDLKSPTIEKLKAHGVQLIQVGDQIKFVLPADKIFVNNTPRLNCEYYPTLNNLIYVLNRYEKITVKVSVYSDSCGVKERKYALTRQQAGNLTHYFWAHGLDARILYAAGYGSLDPISTNETLTGRAQNRRVEVTLRQLPVAEE